MAGSSIVSADPLPPVHKCYNKIDRLTTEGEYSARWLCRNSVLVMHSGREKPRGAVEACVSDAVTGTVCKCQT